MAEDLSDRPLRHHRLHDVPQPVERSRNQADEKTDLAVMH